MLDITVCIMSYNRLSYLREAVCSVLSQTKQPKRIVIYDNGSDGDVFEGVKDFFERGVQWEGADVNHSFIWNFNRAMLDSETRYIMMLHDDDRLCPNFLETQIGLLDANDSLVVISCNGYFIDEAGNKTGETLVPTVGGESIELYTCSGQVAMKYAGNSCIPFSPTIYRSQVVSPVKFRGEFDKVCDAVYFCDLSDIGSIAYQITPLYECRLHSGQDSSYFPYNLMNQLEEFFLSRRCVDDAERNRLHVLLLKQHTARNLKQFFCLVKKGNLSQVASLILDEKFRFVEAAKVIVSWAFKNISRKR